MLASTNKSTQRQNPEEHNHPLCRETSNVTCVICSLYSFSSVEQVSTAVLWFAFQRY
jgi:hypothetical protein